MGSNCQWICNMLGYVDVDFMLLCCRRRLYGIELVINQLRPYAVDVDLYSLFILHFKLKVLPY